MKHKLIALITLAAIALPVVAEEKPELVEAKKLLCLLYTSPSPRD